MVGGPSGRVASRREYRLHGLRRTGSTKLSELGFSDEIVDAVTNHVKRGVRRNYNLNAYLPEKQKAMLAWDGHLRTIISG